LARIQWNNPVTGQIVGFFGLVLANTNRLNAGWPEMTVYVRNLNSPNQPVESFVKQFMNSKGYGFIPPVAHQTLSGFPAALVKSSSPAPCSNTNMGRLCKPSFVTTIGTVHHGRGYIFEYDNINPNVAIQYAPIAAQMVNSFKIIQSPPVQLEVMVQRKCIYMELLFQEILTLSNTLVFSELF
jgi:hypothetical protein